MHRFITKFVHYFHKVFQTTQSNNSDTVSLNRSNNDNGRHSSVLSARVVTPDQNSEEQNTANTYIVQDSTITQEKVLFTVPYRCTLNRDSLKAEMRKVVLEIDTIPKGLTLLLSEDLKDTSIIKSVPYSKSIFTPHLLKPKKIEVQPKIEVQQNWMVLVIVLVLFLVGILRVFYQKKFTLFINAFISRRFSNQIIREENALTQSTSIVLSTVFFISISLFFYLVSGYFHQKIIGYSDWQNFLVILLATISFYFLKLLVNKAGGYIFKTYKETDEYIFNQFLVLQILGLMLIIWCILLKFSTNVNKEIIIYAGFATLILGFVVRMIKSFGIVNMNSYSPVYIFLYLCTLEILPLIIIVKLIIR